MKVLVVGGSGFIGSNIVKYLIERRHEPTIIDKRPNDLNVKTIVMDTTDKTLPLMDWSRYDMIIMEAAVTGPFDFDEKPVESFSSNIIGLLNVLEAAKRSKVRKVVFASSSAVYGNTTEVAREDFLLRQNNANQYSTSKIMGEYLFNSYVNNKAFEGTVVRYFNTYGLGENNKGRYKSIISLFLEEIKENGVAVIYGDGKQSRDLINVKDVARITVELGLKHSGTYNVGTGNSMSFNKILDFFEESGIKFKRKHVKNPIKDYQLFTRADITKLYKIGLQPKIDLKLGIKELIEYYELKKT